MNVSSSVYHTFADAPWYLLAPGQVYHAAPSITMSRRELTVDRRQRDKRNVVQRARPSLVK